MSIDYLEVHYTLRDLIRGFLLEPEPSTSAIIVPHPVAEYFVV